MNEQQSRARKISTTGLAIALVTVSFSAGHLMEPQSSQSGTIAFFLSVGGVLMIFIALLVNIWRRDRDR